MKGWKCGVCGYIHEGDVRPEKCPVCEAPGERFTEAVGEESEINESSAVDSGDKRWRCTVCGYIHTGSEPPETCPVCGASSHKFEELADDNSEDDHVLTTVEKRWKCTVCGFIHAGPEAPEKCPVCGASSNMFLELDKNGNEIGSLPSTSEEETLSSQDSPSFTSRIADLFVHHHLHPISVHFPNGLLPVVFVLLGLSLWLNIPAMETAAFYNLVAVLLALPLVLLTGYLEWQKRYKGHKSFIFIVKIFCALVVLAATNVLVFWRIIDPEVVAPGSPVKWIYFGVAALLLAAAGLAGHLGGKLAFGSRLN